MLKKTMLMLCCLLLAASILGPVRSLAGKKDKRTLVVAVLLHTKAHLAPLEGFKAALGERGYVEGQGIEYVLGGPVEKVEELDGVMAALLARKPDLVYVSGTPAAQAAQKATRGTAIPVVFGPLNDPVGAGLVKDRKRPGGNITGVALADNEGRRMQWAIEIDPKIKSVLLPYNVDDKSALRSLANARQAAATLKLHLIEVPVRSQEEITALIAQFPLDADSIFLPRDGLVMGRLKDFADLAIKQKIMLSITRIDLVEEGVLFSYGYDAFELGKQAAGMADQIFKGGNPGEMPLKSAEDYLVINLKTANAIGLAIPPRILRLARQVIR